MSSSWRWLLLAFVRLTMARPISDDAIAGSVERGILEVAAQATCPGSLPDWCPSGYSTHDILGVGGCIGIQQCPPGTEKAFGKCFKLCKGGYKAVAWIYCVKPGTWRTAFVPSTYHRPHVPATAPPMTGLKCKPGTKLAGVKMIGISAGYCYETSCYDKTLSGQATNVINSLGTLFTDSYANAAKIEAFGKCVVTNLENVKSESGAAWKGFEGSLKTLFSSRTGFIEESTNAYHSLLEPIAKNVLGDTETLLKLLGNTVNTLTTVLATTSVAKPNAKAITTGVVNFTTLVLNSTTTIADRALQTGAGMLRRLSEVEGLEALSCLADDIVEPTVNLLQNNVQGLLVDVVTMFTTLIEDLGGSKLLMGMLDGAVSLSKDLINFVMSADATLTKVDNYLGWGTAKGCGAVISELTDFIVHDGGVKPLGLDCSPGVSLETKPADMVAPVVEAALIGLTQIFFEKIHQWLYAPFVAQLVSATRTLVADIENGLHALCGLIPEAGGAICAAILAVVDTVLGLVLPSLVQDLMNGIYNVVEGFFTQTVPTWTNDIVQWFVTQTKLGKEVADLTLTLQDGINGFVAPVAKLFVPMAQDVFALFMPKLEQAFGQCMSQYNGLYVVLQHKWCKQDLLAANVTNVAVN